eukprot:COSAG05_NODE_3326_length_2148_cov_8.383602_2_plen_224_part_00
MPSVLSFGGVFGPSRGPLSTAELSVSATQNPPGVWVRGIIAEGSRSAALLCVGAAPGRARALRLRLGGSLRREEQARQANRSRQLPGRECTDDAYHDLVRESHGVENIQLQTQSEARFRGRSWWGGGHAHAEAAGGIPMHGCALGGGRRAVATSVTVGGERRDNATHEAPPLVPATSSAWRTFAAAARRRSGSGRGTSSASLPHLQGRAVAALRWCRRRRRYH